MIDSLTPGLVVVAHCRGGFEPETAIELRRLTGDANVAIDAPLRRGFVVASLANTRPRGIVAAIERSPPVFARALFIGTGPHPLFDPAATAGRPDRVAPLTAQIERFCAEFPLSRFSDEERDVARYTSLFVEIPDTNEGKELSGLSRAVASRLADGLRGLGILGDAGDMDTPLASALGSTRSNLHVLFADGAHAYIGASVAPWASAWPMGIPRLRMPGAAPSRSTLKLAEAIVTFLGNREGELLRAGMRAVDLGAAPGGWTWQLAHRGLSVTAVDNGPLKGAVRDDPLVTHLQADGLSYLPKRPVDWMTCDIVEQPARIATLVARWIGDGHARHAIFNLKLPMKKRYDEIRRCESIIVDALAKARIASKLSFRQLYHDREEVTGYVARSRNGRN